MRGRGWGRRVARVAAISAVLLLAVALVGSVALMRDPRPRIERRRSSLVAATPETAAAPVALASSVTAAPAHHVELVLLHAESGLDIGVAIKRPGASPLACADSVLRPAIILLGGHRTGRNAVHLIDDTRGTIVAAMSYPFAGNHRVKGPAIVGEVPGIRQAILDTPAALMLAVDYLVGQPCVDPMRIEAVGVSLGAPFVIVAGAMDSRIARVWSVHGSGGVYDPLEFNLRRQVGSRIASVPLASLAWVLLSGEHLAPERWVGAIAPRPFVMINALADQRVPREGVERLYAAARQPKEMVWLPGAHVRSEAEVVRPLIDLVLTRITSGASAARR